MMPAAIAQVAANDAQEHLGGLDVISISPIFATSMPGMCTCSFIPWPNREGDDFVTKLVSLADVQDMLPAQVNRTTLIMALETHFGRVQILATSWHSQKY